MTHVYGSFNWLRAHCPTLNCSIHDRVDRAQPTKWRKDSNEFPLPSFSSSNIRSNISIKLL